MVSITADELNEMDRDDLIKLRAAVDKALASHDDRQLAKAVERITEVGKEFGFTLPQILEAASKQGKKQQPKGEPKYFHPDDPSKTWTGRGRKPQWVVDLDVQPAT